LVALIGVPLSLWVVGYSQSSLHEAPPFIRLTLMGLVAPGGLLMLGVLATLSAISPGSRWRTPVAIVYGVAVYTLCMSMVSMPAFLSQGWVLAPVG
jgi:tellurite resistance protein TehA-like permease